MARRGRAASAIVEFRATNHGCVWRTRAGTACAHPKRRGALRGGAIASVSVLGASACSCTLGSWGLVLVVNDRIAWSAAPAALHQHERRVCCRGFQRSAEVGAPLARSWRGAPSDPGWRVSALANAQGSSQVEADRGDITPVLSASPAEEAPSVSAPRPGLVLPQSIAVLVLGAVTVLWGAQHSIIKATVSGTDLLEVGVLNVLRFGLAALCFFPWLPRLLPPRGVRASLEWRGGLELGFWLFLGFGLQTVGLLYTTAQRSGLLLYLNVKLVPFFALALLGRNVGISAWLSAAAALLGTLLVAGDGAGGVPPNVGDVLSLAAAAASAMFILRLETFAPSTDAKALNSVSMLVVLLLTVACTLVSAAVNAPPKVLSGPPTSLAAFTAADLASRAGSIVEDHGQALFYLGVVTTALTNWLQTIGQKSVSATTASVIYALDPLWGCFFAYVWLGEVLGPQGFIGCAVLISVWLYQLGAAIAAQGSDVSATRRKPMPPAE